MDAATRDFVRRRAAGRCEYCLLRQSPSFRRRRTEQTFLSHKLFPQPFQSLMSGPD
jgi:hypothetical protein